MRSFDELQSRLERVNHACGRIRRRARRRYGSSPSKWPPDVRDHYERMKSQARKIRREIEGEKAS